MKYAAAITLYNPNKENINNIFKYARSFDYVLVYDNSRTKCKELWNKINDYKNIIYMFNGKNDGLPAAYNRMLQRANTLEIDFLCTLDQDSNFSADNIKKMKSYIEALGNNALKKTAIVAPFIDYESRNRRENKIISVQWVITSGAFLNLKLLYKKNIKYDNYYFIDRFDVDLCRQIKEKKLDILMNCNAVLNQRLGTESGFKHSNHEPLRHYYIAKNRLYFNHKYFSKLKCMYLDILQTIKHLFLVAVFEENKKEKIKAIEQGITDYYNNLHKKRTTW